MTHLRALAPALLLPALLLSGCLEREERITVGPDGSLDIVHLIRGDQADLEGGAARLPGAEAWQVERSARTNKEGKLEHQLRASARFARAADVPERFGPRDADAASDLTQRTALEVVPDGAKRTLYRFSRSYGARSWAPYGYFHKRAFPKEIQDLFKDLQRFSALAPEQQAALVGALRAYERQKAQHWAYEALAAVAPDDRRLPEARLAIGEAVGAQLDAAVTVAMVERLLSGRKDEIEQEGREIEAKVERAALAAAATALALSPEQAAGLEQRLRRLRREFQVTEDLGDESFVVRVKLPGRVLRHDGDALEGGNTVVWRFHGQDLRDRVQRLTAVSVLESE